MLISIIISTYNWPSALQRVLECLNHQQDKNFEIIVADDGSDSSTKQMITNFKKIAKFLLPMCGRKI